MTAPTTTPKSTDDDPLIVEFLRDSDVMCPMCAYNLRGQRTPVCPECGCAAKLELRPVSPHMAAWIFGLIGLSAGIGFNGLFAAILIMLESTDSIFEAWSIPTGAVTCSAGTWIWIRQSGWLRRLTLGTRWTLSILCWLVTFGFAALFVWIVT